MTEEELNNKMDFIVEQLGQTVVGLQMMKEAHEADYDKFHKQMSRLESAFVGMFNIMTKNTEQIEKLAQSVEELRAQSAETRERLDIFIVVLEKYISRDQNGNGSTKS